MSEDSISGDGTHPDMDVRIENLVTKLELHEMDPLWGYLGVALRLWLLVFGGLSIEEDMQQPGFGSYKDDFQKPHGEEFSRSGICGVYPAYRNRGDGIFARHHRALQGR